MSSTTKPLDRRRPFKRIDNEAFIPSKVLDGDGVACGCHTQKDIGDIDAKLDAFMKDTRNKMLGAVVSNLIDALKAALNPPRLARLLVDLIRKELGNVPGKIAEAPLAILGGLGAILFAPVNAIIDPIVGIIESGAQAFMRLFATPVLLRAVRVIPQWVPVTPKASDNSVDRSQVIEVEGICVRSYGNPIDVPLAQWHTWFAWNVQVQLEAQYGRALSPVSDPPNTSGADGGVSIIKPGSFEIQVDAGALFASNAPYRAGFKSDDMPNNDGPHITPGGKQVLGETDFETDFFWPMPGMFIWASGRHVYDCSRVTHEAGATGGRDSEATPPLMCAMMQPARAMATARFQAVVFPENGEFAVPAIEFLFIACKRGGYIKHDKLADEDYVFIIDLPPGPATASPFPIANTDDEVPHNTITLRPRLLKKLKFLQPIGSSSAQPILELLPPAEPGRAPQQVRLRIPQGVMSGDAYGFKLSLGWHDPTREFARQVLIYELDVKSLTMRLTDRENPAQKLRNLVGRDQENALSAAIMAELHQVKVEVPFIGPVKPMEIPEVAALVEPVVTKLLDTLLDIIVQLMPSETEEEWLLRMGVNGDWATFFLKPRIKRVTPPGQPPTNQPVDFNASGLVFRGSLAIGDELRFGAHGSEFDPVGDIMRSPLDQRTLRLPNGADVPWSNIVSPDNKKQFDDILFDVMHRLMFDTTGGLSKLSLGFDNAPLGLIDSDSGPAGGTQPQDNPMRAQNVFDPPVRLKRAASFARAISPEMILVEDRRPDYEVVYELKVRRQIADDPAPPA